MIELFNDRLPWMLMLMMVVTTIFTGGVGVMFLYAKTNIMLILCRIKRTLGIQLHSLGAALCGAHQYKSKPYKRCQFSYRLEFDRSAFKHKKRKDKMCKLSLLIVSMLVIVLVSGQNVVREKNNNDGSGSFDFTYADTFHFLDLFLWLFFSVQ